MTARINSSPSPYAAHFKAAASYEQSTQVELPPHFILMKGERAKLLCSLLKRGVIDSRGNFNPQFTAFPLPPLRTEEILLIQDQINKKFNVILSKEDVCEIAMRDLLRFVSSRDIHVKTVQLIGGYTSYLLFSKTDYVKRVFKSLGLDDLYEAPFYPRVPADIDIRMHVEGAFPLMGKDLQIIRDRVIDKMASFFPHKQKREASRAIKDRAFKTLATIDTGINCFQILSLKESPVDLVIAHRLTCQSVFTLDDLFIPIENLNEEIIPQSHCGKPLESFFHSLLGLIHTNDSYAIDESGWLRFIFWITKGGWSVNQELEPFLFEKMDKVWLSKDPMTIERLRKEIEKWTQKHFSNVSNAHLAFVFNICSHLRGRLTPSQIEMIWNKKIPFETFSAYFLLCAHILAQQENNKVEILGFEKPAFHLRLGKSFIKLEGSLNNDALSVIQNSEEHEELLQLFFKLCPSFQDIQPIPEVSILLNSPSRFLKYIGFLFSENKQAILERYYLDFRSLPINQTEIEKIIGLHASTEEWIITLFDRGKEVGFEILKEQKFEENFILKLIERLTYQQPKFALRLFFQFKDHFSPSICMHTILECGRIVHQLIQTTEEHHHLVEMIGRAIPSLLDHQDFIPPARKKFFSQGLLWYCKQLKESTLLDAALRRHYFTPQETNLALSIQMDHEIETLKMQPSPKGIEKAYQLLKSGNEKEIFSIEKQVGVFLTLFEISRELKCELIDLKWLLSKISLNTNLSAEIKKRAVSIILNTLDTDPLLFSSEIASIGKSVSLLLTNTPTEYVELIKTFLENPILSNETKLRLIDSIEPIFQTFFMNHVMVVCIDMHNNEKNAHLARWLLKTSFFQQGARDGLQALLFITSEELLKEYHEVHAKLLYDLTIKYFDDFKEISFNWLSLFNLLSDMVPNALYPLFNRIEKEEIKHPDPSTLSDLFSKTVKTLISKKDKNILKLVGKYKSYKHQFAHPTLALECCKFFLEAIHHFSSKHNLTQECDYFYHEAKALLNLLEFSPPIQKLWGEIELNYVNLLFLTNRNEEGKKIIDQLSSEIHSIEYWAEAAPLINTLTKSAQLEYVDELLIYTELAPIPNLKLDRIFALLFAYPNLDRLIRAGRLWRQAIGETLKLNQENWQTCVHICEELSKYKTSQAEEEITLVLQTSNHFFETFKKNIGEIFCTQSISLILKSWTRSPVRTKNSPYFPSYVTHILKSLPTYFKMQDGKRILFNLPEAIAALSFDNEKAFIDLGSYFWALIVIKKNTKKDKNYVALSKDEYYALKRNFIQEILNANIPSHPNPALLINSAEKYRILLGDSSLFKS